MLKHHHATPQAPPRVVILGAGGFVGGAAARRLAGAGIQAVALGRPGHDLLAAGVAERLAAALRPDDALVVVSAKAPCKDAAMMVENLRMIEPVCAALAKTPVAHLVYVSSDAVYRDSDGPLSEASCAEPGSAHGAMHRAREVLLGDVAKCPYAVLRPTLIYGVDDPHNGYGPNRFRRLARAGKEIVLFGEGEERRDHVLVDDVAELLRLILVHRSAGVLNAATGAVASFRQIAETVVGLFDRPVAIKGSPRQGAMPHNGYRPFDPAGTARTFPQFRYTALADGLAATHRQYLQRPA